MCDAPIPSCPGSLAPKASQTPDFYLYHPCPSRFLANHSTLLARWALLPAWERCPQAPCLNGTCIQSLKSTLNVPASQLHVAFTTRSPLVGPTQVTDQVLRTCLRDEPMGAEDSAQGLPWRAPRSRLLMGPRAHQLWFPTQRELGLRSGKGRLLWVSETHQENVGREVSRPA